MKCMQLVVYMQISELLGRMPQSQNRIVHHFGLCSHVKLMHCDMTEILFKVVLTQHT